MSFMAGCRAGLEVVTVGVDQSLMYQLLNDHSTDQSVVCLCGQWTCMMTGYKMVHKDK